MLEGAHKGVPQLLLHLHAATSTSLPPAPDPALALCLQNRHAIRMRHVHHKVLDTPVVTRNGSPRTLFARTRALDPALSVHWTWRDMASPSCQVASSVSGPELGNVFFLGRCTMGAEKVRGWWYECTVLPYKQVGFAVRSSSVLVTITLLHPLRIRCSL